MKKQIKQTKLVLQTQTIRALDDAAKTLVVGGLSSLVSNVSYPIRACNSQKC